MIQQTALTILLIYFLMSNCWSCVWYSVVGVESLETHSRVPVRLVPITQCTLRITIKVTPSTKTTTTTTTTNNNDSTKATLGLEYDVPWQHDSSRSISLSKDFYLPSKDTIQQSSESMEASYNTPTMEIFHHLRPFHTFQCTFTRNNSQNISFN